MNTFIKIFIFNAIFTFSHQNVEKTKDFKIKRKTNKFIRKNTYSLILYCKEKLDYYDHIQKLFEDHVIKFKIITVKDKYLTDTYTQLKVKNFPKLRLYFGHLKIFIDYFGILTIDKNLKEEEYQEEINNIKDNILLFLNERLKESYKKISKNSQNLNKQIDYVTKNVSSFVFYRGAKDNACYKLFITLSQAIDKIKFLYLEDNLTKELGVIDDIDDGFYMKLNYKEPKNLIKICNLKSKFALYRKNVVRKFSLISYYLTEKLRLLTQADINLLKDGEKIIVLNKEFFKSAEENSRMEVFLKDLDKFISKKLRIENFEMKKEKKNVHIFKAEINEKPGNNSYETLLNIIGNGNKRNFVFLFEKKKNSLIKFKFEVKDPLKINFSTNNFIEKTEKLEIKPFIKSDDRVLNLEEKKKFIENKFKKISTFDVLKIKKNLKKKQFFLYCSNNFNKETLEVLTKYFMNKKIMIFLLDLNQNDFEKFLEKDFILLKPKNFNSFIKIDLEFFNENEEEFYEEDL